MSTLVHLQPHYSVPRGEWLLVSAGGIDWRLRPEFAGTLDPSDLDRLPVAESQEIIKTGSHRTVFRRELTVAEDTPDNSRTACFVKHFRIPGWRALLQNVIRPCKAELEWRAIERVKALEIPTAQVVAVGRIHQGGLVRDSFLVTRDVEAVQLDQWLIANAGSLTQPFRCKLAQELGRIAGRLHAGGVEHTDFHPGNVLIRLGPRGEPRLWLIDLHAMRIRPKLSPTRAARSLAALNQFFQHRASRTDLLRFFRAYLDTFQTVLHVLDRTAESALRQTFMEHCRAATESLWDRADRAWRRGNRHQRKLTREGVLGRGLAVLNATWLESVVANPETLFSANPLRWCKNTGKRRVAEIEMRAHCAPSAQPSSSQSVLRAFAKCVESRGVKKWLARWRTSRVRRAWEIGHAFLRRGLPTPRPLLFLEAQRFECDRQYLVTEAVPNSQTLVEFCRANWPNMTIVAQREWSSALSARLAQLVRRMHDLRYDHRDLKFENLLVSKPREDGSASTPRPEVWFLDLDAVQRWPILPRARCIQNLSRINVSTLHLPRLPLTDRLRFLRTYLGVQFPQWKAWWKRIAAKSQRKLIQNHLRGRRLS